MTDLEPRLAEITSQLFSARFARYRAIVTGEDTLRWHNLRVRELEQQQAALLDQKRRHERKRKLTTKGKV